MFCYISTKLSLLWGFSHTRLRNNFSLLCLPLSLRESGGQCPTLAVFWVPQLLCFLKLSGTTGSSPSIRHEPSHQTSFSWWELTDATSDFNLPWKMFFEGQIPWNTVPMMDRTIGFSRNADAFHYPVSPLLSHCLLLKFHCPQWLQLSPLNQ